MTSYQGLNRFQLLQARAVLKRLRDNLTSHAGELLYSDLGDDDIEVHSAVWDAVAVAEGEVAEAAASILDGHIADLDRLLGPHAEPSEAEHAE